MKGWIRRRVLRLAVVTPVLFAVAGGIAYATIPDSGKVYRACMLNNIGTIRLIDPTLPSTNLMSKCSSLETPVSWNESGQQGLQGIQGAAGPAGANGTNGIDGKNGLDGKNGAPGTNGTNGVSPNVTSLAPGDAHCQTGGASITDANGTTAYVCNGQKGVDGTNATPFSGTFTSPNNLYSINVSDNGIRLRSPGGTVTISGDTIDLNTGGLLLNAAFIGMHAGLISMNGPDCLPAARVSTLYPSPLMPATVTGSSTVCIGY